MTPALGRYAAFGVVIELALLLASAGAEVLGRVPVRAASEYSTIAISGNGRFVAGADASGRCGGSHQIFVFDRQSSAIECISVNDAGAAANDFSRDPSISADGQIVAFLSDATNLAAGCEPSTPYKILKLYIRNRRTRHTACGAAALDRIPLTSLWEPTLSADGSTLVIYAATTGAGQIFAIALSNGVPTGSVEIASVGSAVGGPAVPGDRYSERAAVSADGRFVAFESLATNLVPNDTNRDTDIFVRDRILRTTVCITCSLFPGTNGYFGQYPSISADGRFVAFNTFALRPDGSFSSYIFRTDMLTGEVVNVCPALQRVPPSNSEYMQTFMSADGRFVLFPSGAQGIVPGDTNSALDVYAADLGAPGSIAYTRVSLGADGIAEPNEHAPEYPFFRMIALSGNARVVAFVSIASTLVPGDDTFSREIFVARVPSGPEQVLTGAGAGGGPHARAITLQGTALMRGDFFAYPPAFTGGVAVAYGDVDGDGAADIVTGAGPGGGPHVRVFSAAQYGSDGLTPHELTGFMAYDASFGGGVSVAVGDVTGDGFAEIITAAGAGGGPHVRIFQVHRSREVWGRVGISEYAGFMAYAPAFSGGVRVAVGDVDGDGVGEIITAAGPGGGPDVWVFRADGGRVRPVAFFTAYTPGFTGGVFVAAGDVDGDGRDEIITGADAGGGPHVRALSVVRGASSVFELVGFMAYDPAFRGGVRVASGDLDGDGLAEIITGAGPGGAPHVLAIHRAPDGRLWLAASLLAYAPNHTGGVFVAAAPH